MFLIYHSPRKLFFHANFASSICESKFVSRFLVPGLGFEPRLPGPEPGVLPLDDPGVKRLKPQIDRKKDIKKNPDRQLALLAQDSFFAYSDHV